MDRKGSPQQMPQQKPPLGGEECRGGKRNPNRSGPFPKRGESKGVKLVPESGQEQPKRRAGRCRDCQTGDDRRARRLERRHGSLVALPPDAWRSCQNWRIFCATRAATCEPPPPLE